MTDRRREKRSRLVAGGRSRTRATWLFVNARDVRASRGHLDARSRWRGETVVGILAGLTRAFAARLARASSSRTSPAGLMARPRRKQTTSAAADVVVPDPPPNPKRRRGPAPAKATARDATPAPTPAVSPDADRPLLDLGPLEEGVLLRRPSSRNRSPYVGDVEIVSGPAKGSVCVTHLPNLDSGGKCRPGARLLCRRQPGVGPDTVGPYGTPKCELVCQLLRCDEPENRAPDPSLDLAGDGVWISAHPSIGEKLVAELLRRGAFDDRLRAPVAAPSQERLPSPTSPPTSPPPVSTQVTVRREATSSTSGGYRPDFRVTHADGSMTLIETKQVVDTDYDPATAAEAAAKQPGHPVYARGGAVVVDDAAAAVAVSLGRYRRAGIFPWGKRGQKGPDGEAVVSARAIEHLRELTHVARRGGETSAAIVLMVGRHDAASARPNGAACPSFARHLAEAEHAGVRVLAHKVRWGEGEEAGRAFDGGPLPMESATSPGDEVLVPKPKTPKKKTTPVEADASGSETKKTTKKTTGKRETKTGSKRRTEKVLAKGATSRKGPKGRSDSDSDEDFAP